MFFNPKFLNIVLSSKHSNSKGLIAGSTFRLAQEGAFI